MQVWYSVCFGTKGLWHWVVYDDPEAMIFRCRRIAFGTETSRLEAETQAFLSAGPGAVYEGCLPAKLRLMYADRSGPGQEKVVQLVIRRMAMCESVRRWPDEVKRHEEAERRRREERSRERAEASRREWERIQDEFRRFWTGRGRCGDAHSLDVHYLTLKLKPGCGRAAVVSAWRSRAVATHPDKGGNSADFIRAKNAKDALMAVEK